MSLKLEYKVENNTVYDSEVIGAYWFKCEHNMYTLIILSDKVCIQQVIMDSNLYGDLGQHLKDVCDLIKKHMKYASTHTLYVEHKNKWLKIIIDQDQIVQLRTINMKFDPDYIKQVKAEREMKEQELYERVDQDIENGCCSEHNVVSKPKDVDLEVRYYNNVVEPNTLVRVKTCKVDDIIPDSTDKYNWLTEESIEFPRMVFKHRGEQVFSITSVDVDENLEGYIKDVEGIDRTAAKINEIITTFKLHTPDSNKICICNQYTDKKEQQKESELIEKIVIIVINSFNYTCGKTYQVILQGGNCSKNPDIKSTILNVGFHLK